MTTATLTPPATTRRTPSPSAVAYARLDLRRQLRDRVGMFFTVALPAFLFVVFGLGDDEPFGSGNVAFYVMAGMAAYGAVTATTTVAGSAATEQQTGWGRQTALTPLAPLAFVGIKAAVSMVVAAVPIALIFGIGAATGASGTVSDWWKEISSTLPETRWRSFVWFTGFLCCMRKMCEDRTSNGSLL